MDDTKDHDSGESPRPISATAGRKQHRKILGQTTAAWYIYWICAVASIANMWVYCQCHLVFLSHFVCRFQGFDSGIYSIIISDSRFIDYFGVKGARSGVVASMGKFRPDNAYEEESKRVSQSRECHWEPLHCVVVHLVSRPMPCICVRNCHPTRWSGFTSWRNSLCK